MNNVRFTDRINDGTTSYAVMSKLDQRTLGRVTNIQYGVWSARTSSRTVLGEYRSRADAGEALWLFHHSS